MNNEKWWYLSSNAMTVAVRTNAADIIQETPYIVRKFRFQPLGNLTGWMNKQGGFKMQEMRNPAQE